MHAYRGVFFKTRLEAKWAAFFDLAGWSWRQNPVGCEDWAPDFYVTFPCGHSECGGYHSLLISVLPVDRIDDFGRHPCLQHAYGEGISADSGAAFGTSPCVTHWEMNHGAGGGHETLADWVANAADLWRQAETAIAAEYAR